MTQKYSKKERFIFSLKLIFGFPVVGILWTGIIYLSAKSNTLDFRIAFWIGGIGALCGLLCLVNENIFLIISWFWHKFIFVFDTTITWTTLPFFYYCIFSPFALVIRIFGKANMKKMSPKAESHWRDVKQKESNKQYLRQF